MRKANGKRVAGVAGILALVLLSSATWFGETITPEQVNYNGSFSISKARQGRSREQTVEAGSLPPNAFGLHDMHGNVWEWCEDRYDESFYGKPESTLQDPCNREGGPSGAHVVRGGGWGDYAWNCRSAVRAAAAPGARHEWLGFRPAFGPLASE